MRSARLGVRVMAVMAMCLMALVVPVRAQEAPSEGHSLVVATTEVLGSVVGELVGTAAEVEVLMPRGTDPHTWQPSARDTETVFNADVVVANGLALEQGLQSILDEARATGIPVFYATDQIAVRGADGAGADDGHEHQHDAADPHFWLDPLAMRDVVLALGSSLAEAGIEVDTGTERLVNELVTLDTELASILSVVPDGQRKLVTGHDSLGYFADRYGFVVVGTVIPGQTTSQEPSARDLAELIDLVRAEDVPAVFTEVGTPQSVAQAVADEGGAQIVELDVAQLPEDGSYADFMRALATTIATALAG